MENVMTKGFCELNEQEMMETDGGIAILPIIVMVGAAMLLTGCTSGSGDSSSETTTTTAAPRARDVQIHTQTGCTPGNCTQGWGSDCPVR